MNLNKYNPLLIPQLSRWKASRKILYWLIEIRRTFGNKKSKDDWILYGDGNTKVFHVAVKIDRAKNAIVKLSDKNGNIQRSEASKGQVAIQYFKDLF